MTGREKDVLAALEYVARKIAGAEIAAYFLARQHRAIIIAENKNEFQIEGIEWIK